MRPRTNNSRLARCYARGMTTAVPTPAATGAPARSGLILTALIFGALVCNINLAVANVALPDIGKAFGASQVLLNVIAVGCTLGLAMSVLYFGAIGDRFGRKQLLTLGLILTVVASLLSAFAGSAEMLIFARLFTGLAAGMAYPTTLALITALWAPGASRTKAIALWSGVSAGAASLGPVLAGLLLTVAPWGSVFLIAVPIALAGLVLVLIGVPKGVNESTEPIDHLGGVLSVIMIGALVLALSFVASSVTQTFAFVGFGVAAVAGIAFFIRQRTASSPLYDLSIAKRRLFWVPAIGGMIVFGSLMGAAFIGQQFIQNVLGLSTALSGLSGLPSAFALVLAAPVSARFILSYGSRFTMLVGYAFVFLGFLIMFTWNEHTPFVFIALTYGVVGIGAGLALTPASRSLTSSTPVRKVGMASGTSDLQRDLGGSVMQSILGAILAAGFASSFAKEIASSANASSVSKSVADALESSFASASRVAAQYPEYAEQIMSAAKHSFLAGANFAYIAGAIAVLLGAAVVALFLPGKSGEAQLTESYAREDANA